MTAREKAVLIVDDEAELRDLLAWEFRSRGWSVHEAANGRIAREVLERVAVDVVVTDVRMPNGTGLELVEWIRARDPRTPRVLLMSGYAELAPKALVALGVSACVPKPFDPEVLADAAERALGE